jgi:HD-GYP domain-containing protein (c-di-GMP phosphodiesterase class II)
MGRTVTPVNNRLPQNGNRRVGVAKKRIRLHGVGPSLEGKVWESEQALRIGRSPTFEVILGDTTISRRHAEVYLGDQGWVVRDLDSTNGTFLNGARVNQVERKIHERDLLQCGNVVMIVTLLEEEFPSADGPLDNWQVAGTAQHSWEEAINFMALGVTRHSRPGEQLLALLRTGQHLYQSTSLDDLLRQSLGDVVTLLKARRGCVLLYEEGGGAFAVRAAYAPANEVTEGGVRCYSSTLARRCFQREESLLCHDVQHDPELVTAQSVTKGVMSSIICALLRTPQRRLGVLHLDRGPYQEPFTLDDLNLADGIAAGMSASVASAQLIQDKQRNTFIQAAVALAKALALRHPQSSGHAQRVTDYALLLADELRLPALERQCIQIAGPLHDIGKIGVDDKILNKPDQLTPAEYEQIKLHPVKGSALLESIPDLAPALPVVRNHHERWDGKGYPDGLCGEAIPKVARVVAVADAFDAITHDAPYRKADSVEAALSQIHQGAGSQFDPECAHVFLRLRPRLEQQLRHWQEQHTENKTERLSEADRLLLSGAGQ